MMIPINTAKPIIRPAISCGKSDGCMPRFKIGGTVSNSVVSQKAASENTMIPAAKAQRVRLERVSLSPFMRDPVNVRRSRLVLRRAVVLFDEPKFLQRAFHVVDHGAQLSAPDVGSSNRSSIQAH